MVGQGPLGGMCPGCLLDLAEMETDSATESLSLPTLRPAGVQTPTTGVASTCSNGPTTRSSTSHSG
jgi:hypothetical protein